MFNVRLATPHDALVCADIHRQCFADIWEAEVFQQLLGRATVLGLLCLDDADQVEAGLLVFQTVPPEGEILTFCTIPGKRKRGVARHLLRCALETIADLHIESVFLEVGHNNLVAKQLYLSEGFEPVGRRPKYYQSGANSEDAVVMRLRLRGG